jgi:ketosteroid isomerase-like protein
VTEDTPTANIPATNTGYRGLDSLEAEVESMTNRQVIEDLYKSFLTRDPEPALAAFTDESIWVEPGDNARAGVYRGVVEIAQHAEHCHQLCDGNWGTDVLETVVGDRYVVVVERALALRNGESMNMLVNTVYEMKNGVIISLNVLPYDCAEWNTFWS